VKEGRNKKSPKRKRRAAGLATILMIWAVVWQANAAIHRAAYESLLKGDLHRALSLLRFTVTFEPNFFLHRGRMGNPELRRAFIETDKVLRERLVWATKTSGPIIASPAAATGAIFIGNNSRDFYKLNADTGKVIWKYRAGGAIEPKPLVAGDIICFAAHDGIHAVDTGTGRRKWFRFVRWAESSPAYATGAVFVGADERKVLALDIKTGKTIWSRPVAGPVESAPSVYEGKIYVGCNKGILYSLDAATGKPLWTYRTGGSIQGQPLTSGGRVFAGCSLQKFFALEADTGKLIWKRNVRGSIEGGAAGMDDIVVVGTKLGAVYAFDERNGKTLWTYHGTGWVKSNPTIYKGAVYVGSHYGFLTALDLRTGRRLWRFLAGWDFDESIPLIHEGRLFIGNMDKRVYALKI